MVARPVKDDESQTGRLPGPTPPPALLALAAGAAQTATAFRASRASPGLAAVVGAVSTGMLVAPVAQFARRSTTVDPRPGARPHDLVETGPNGFSRNPMYVGMAGLLVAHAAWRGSVAALAPAAAFLLWMDRVQVPLEERALHEAFGASYERYRSRVRRWL